MSKVALLLNGGGACAICQGGMIQGLCDSGVEYDALYTSSVGSLNGAMLHAGRLELLKECWMNVRSDNVYRWHFGNLFTLFNQASIFDDTYLLKTIKTYVDPDAVRSNPKPFVNDSRPNGRSFSL